jgi:hypothetical protein
MYVATSVKLDGISYQICGWYEPAEYDTNTPESISISKVFVGNDDQDIIDHLSKVTIKDLEQAALKGRCHE